MTATYAPALTAPGITDAGITELGRLCDDTPWMAERRTAAWATYQSLPMPSSRDEHWRFTNMRRVKLDGVPTFNSLDVGGELDAPALLSLLEARPLAQLPRAGTLSHVGGGTADVSIGELPEGVVFCSLDEALRTHADLVHRHWGTVVPVGDTVDDKFVALAEATFASGAFLYVPRNVTVEQPLLAQVLHARAGGHVNWRVLVVLEENAEATFVEEYLSADAQAEGFSNAVVELVAGPGSRLHYTTFQDYAVPVTHFATHRVVAQRDAQVEWNAVGLGASLGKSRMEVRLAGPGSHVKLTGAYFLDGRQELDYDTQQVHEAPNAVSDLSFKGALADRAKSVWRGMIVVDQGAQGTDAYQENRNLLLSRDAHADSIPGLQIEANEVRCTHGATLSKVDPEQLFYLQSRGISRDEAVRTIVRGFYASVLARITSEPIRLAVQDALWARMDAPAAAAASR